MTTPSPTAGKVGPGWGAAHRPTARSIHPGLAPDACNMAIYNRDMDISVSRFKQACLEMVRQVETSGRPIAITRRGKVVARLSPASASKPVPPMAPWERVRAQNAATCHFDAGESVLSAGDFEAAR